jgi:hypothetical protein
MWTIALAWSAPVVDAGVTVSTVDGAGVCAVHLHGDEADARTALRRLSCANRLEITDAAGADRTTRRLAIRDGARRCDVDPNRIFTEAGRDAQLAACRIAGAREALAAFVQQDLLPALDRCRAGGLPVVAFHNNSAFTVHTFDDVAIASTVQPGRPQDILLLTSPADYDALSRKRTTVLQSQSPRDDGSLSVWLAHDRYVNIETLQGGGPDTASAMAADVIAQIAPGSCPIAAPGTPRDAVPREPAPARP